MNHHTRAYCVDCGYCFCARCLDEEEPPPVRVLIEKLLDQDKREINQACPVCKYPKTIIV